MISQDDYFEGLCKQFGSLKIEIAYHDTGATLESIVCYVVVSGLTKDMLKQRSYTALDLSNYLWRKFGFKFETCPEYHSLKEARNSLTFYITRKQMESMHHLQQWLVNSYNSRFPVANKTPIVWDYSAALYYGRRFEVPNEV